MAYTIRKSVKRGTCGYVQKLCGIPGKGSPEFERNSPAARFPSFFRPPRCLFLETESVVELWGDKGRDLESLEGFWSVVAFPGELQGGSHGCRRRLGEMVVKFQFHHPSTAVLQIHPPKFLVLQIKPC